MKVLQTVSKKDTDAEISAPVLFNSSRSVHTFRDGPSHEQHGIHYRQTI